MSFEWKIFWTEYILRMRNVNQDTITYTKKVVCKPFTLLTCEYGHPMFLTIGRLYQVHDDSFAYPGMYFKNKLIDLNDGKDIYTCKTCKASMLIIDREGIHVFVRGEKRTIWPITIPSQKEFMNEASKQEAKTLLSKLGKL